MTLRDATPGRMRGRKLQERRLRVWSKDPHCDKCRRQVDYPSGFELDHDTPLFKGGEDSEDNCRLLCIDCHYKKSRQDCGIRERTRFDPAGRVIW